VKNQPPPWLKKRSRSSTKYSKTPSPLINHRSNTHRSLKYKFYFLAPDRKLQSITSWPPSLLLNDRLNTHRSLKYKSYLLAPDGKLLSITSWPLLFSLIIDQWSFKYTLIAQIQVLFAGPQRKAAEHHVLTIVICNEGQRSAELDLGNDLADIENGSCVQRCTCLVPTCKNSNHVRPRLRVAGACTVVWMKRMFGSMDLATC